MCKYRTGNILLNTNCKANKVMLNFYSWCYICWQKNILTLKWFLNGCAHSKQHLSRLLKVVIFFVTFLFCFCFLFCNSSEPTSKVKCKKKKNFFSFYFQLYCISVRKHPALWCSKVKPRKCQTYLCQLNCKQTLKAVIWYSAKGKKKRSTENSEFKVKISFFFFNYDKSNNKIFSH